MSPFAQFLLVVVVSILTLWAWDAVYGWGGKK